MTILQSLAIKLIMLGITVGVIYWALSSTGDEQIRLSEPQVMAEAPARLNEQPPAAEDPGPAAGHMVTILDEPPAAGDDPEPESASKVTVLTQPERMPSSPVRHAKSLLAPQAPRPVRFPLDLNKAPLHDLLELPGIGEKLAERIVKYRKDHGHFQSIEDLRKVKGIGKKRMERLRPLVMTTAAHD
jgi:competence protein ComEA